MLLKGTFHFVRRVVHHLFVKKRPFLSEQEEEEEEEKMKLQIIIISFRNIKRDKILQENVSFSKTPF